MTWGVQRCGEELNAKSSDKWGTSISYVIACVQEPRSGPRGKVYVGARGGAFQVPTGRPYSKMHVIRYSQLSSTVASAHHQRTAGMCDHGRLRNWPA